MARNAQGHTQPPLAGWGDGALSRTGWQFDGKKRSAFVFTSRQARGQAGIYKENKREHVARLSGMRMEEGGEGGYVRS